MKPHWAWQRVEAAVGQSVRRLITFSFDPLGDEQHANFQRNRSTLEFLGQLQKADGLEVDGAGRIPAKQGFGHHEAASELLQVAGHDNWADSTKITIYLGMSADINNRSFRESLSEHVVRLVQLLLLNQRPAQPAQSRWTGVPCVARFAYGLFAFHNLFKHVMPALLESSTNKNAGRGRGRGRGRGGRGQGTRDARPEDEETNANADPVPAAADADAGRPELYLTVAGDSDSDSD